MRRNNLRLNFYLQYLRINMFVLIYNKK